MKFFKLEDLQIRYFVKVWNYFDGDRRKTCDALGISLRGATILKNKSIDLGYKLKLRSRKTSFDDCGFPTNAARLKYRDEMINRDK